MFRRIYLCELDLLVPQKVFPDSDVGTGWYVIEPVDAGLQNEASDHDSLGLAADGSHPDLKV